MRFRPFWQAYKRPSGPNIKPLELPVSSFQSDTLPSGAKSVAKPLSPEEITQLTALVKEAMGFSQTRGDSLNLVNAAFNVVEPEVTAELPIWQRPENIALAKDLGKALVIGVVFLYLLFGVVRPLIRNLLSAPRIDPAFEPAMLEAEAEVHPAIGHSQRLTAAKQLAKSDPKRVANVVKSWVSADE